MSLDATRHEELVALRAEVAALREALTDFFDGACLVSRQFNIVQPFVELAIKHADVLRWIEARRATDPAWTEDLVKAAALAVYDCEMPDHDALAVLIHNSDFIDGGKPLPEQLADVLAVCTTIASAVIATIAPRIRAEETEDIAAVGAILFDHLAGDRPELARAIIATLTPRIARVTAAIHDAASRSRRMKSHGG